MSSGVVIVDTSYVVFAKWYSALSWYKSSINRHPDIGTIMDVAVFRQKISNMFETSLSRVINYTGMNGSEIVFARDCQRSSVWRRHIFNGYKDGRAMNDNFNGNVFGYVYDKIIPEILSGCTGCVIGVDGAEADDVIGVICRHVRSTRPLEKVLIISNDNDCIQLVDDGTSVVNLFLQDVGSRRGDLTPKQYLQCRILSGDRSDNIPSIVQRCGIRAVAKYVTGHDETDLREAWPGYNANDILMNLDNTPDHIKTEIINRFDARHEATAHCLSFKRNGKAFNGSRGDGGGNGGDIKWIHPFRENGSDPPVSSPIHSQGDAATPG